MKVLRNKVVMLVLLAFVVACAANQVKKVKKVSYKGLYAAGLSYKTGMETVRELQDAGLITQEQREEINKVAQYYHDAYHLAVEALAAYARTASEEDFESMQDRLIAVGKELGKFITYVNPIFVKYGKAVMQ